MTTVYQMTLAGAEHFLPPRYNLQTFLHMLLQREPRLLDPHCHGRLMLELARHAGLKPDQWGVSLDAIKWLMEISPDIERAVRKFRADAL